MVTCHPSLAKTLAFATAMIKLVLSLFTVSVSRSAVILYAIESPLIAASLATAWFAVLTAIRRQGDHLAAPPTATFDNLHPKRLLRQSSAAGTNRQTGYQERVRAIAPAM